MAEKIGATVVVGLPSDQSKTGLSLDWRVGIEHVADAGAVIDTLTGKNANARVTLIGMSNGARSVTYRLALARRGAPKLAGVVLMSAGARPFGHRHRCAQSRQSACAGGAPQARQLPLYVDVEPFAKWHDFLTVDDFKQPRLNGSRRECGNDSAHQFAGKEDIVFTAVADWLKTGKLKEAFL